MTYFEALEARYDDVDEIDTDELTQLALIETLTSIESELRSIYDILNMGLGLINSNLEPIPYQLEKIKLVLS